MEDAEKLQKALDLKAEAKRQTVERLKKENEMLIEVKMRLQKEMKIQIQEKKSVQIRLSDQQAEI